MEKQKSSPQIKHIYMIKITLKVIACVYKIDIKKIKLKDHDILKGYI